MASFATIGIIGKADIGQVLTALSVVRRQITFLSSANAQLGASSKQLGNSIAAAGNQVRKFGHDIRGLGNEIAATGFRLSFLLSLPITGFFSSTVASAAEFEKNLTQIINLTDASAASVTAWRQEILDLSVALGRTPLELSKGLLAVTSAGFTGAEAMDVLTNASRASSLGLGEVETVARTIVGILGAYGVENISAAEATDQLVAIIDQGNFEVDKLAGTLGRVTGLAATMGVEFSQLGAFIAAFSRSGVDGDVAITSLRSTLTALIKPTQGAIDKLAEFDITIDEVRAAIADPSIGLDKTLIALASVLGEDDEAMGRLIGTSRGLAGVLFNTGQIANDYLQIQDNIANSTGIVEEGFARLQGTTSFQFEQLRAAANVFGVTIGSILLPAANQLVQKLLPLLAAMKEFAEQHPKIVLLATGFGLLAAALSPVLIVIGLLISTVGTIIGTLAGFVSVLSALLSPIGLVGVAMAVLAALFVASARDIADKAGVEFDNIAQNARSWGQNIVIQIARGIAEAAIAVVTALINIGNIIASWLAPGSPPRLLPDLNEWGAEWMNEILHGFTAADWDIFNDVAGIVEQFFRSLGTDVVAEDALIPAIMNAREAIALAVQEMERFGQITQETMSHITGLFGASAQDVEAYINTLFDLQEANEAVATAQEHLNDVQQEYDDMLAPLTGRLAEIREAREDIADQMRIDELNAIIAAATANEDWLAVTLAQMELEEIAIEDNIEAIEAQEDAAVAAAQAEVDAAEAHAQALEEQAAAQLALIQAQIETNNLMQEQIDILERLAKAIEDVGGAGGGAGDADPSGVGGGLAGALAGLAESGLGNLGDLLEEAINGALNQAEGPLNELKSRFQEIFDEIKGFFSPLLGEGGLFDQLTDVWSDVFIEGAKRLKEFALSISTWWTGTAKPFLVDAINNFVVPALTEFRNWLTPRLETALNNVRDSIRDDINPALQELSRIVSEELAESLPEDAITSWEDFKEAVAGFIAQSNVLVGFITFGTVLLMAFAAAGDAIKLAIGRLMEELGVLGDSMGELGFSWSDIWNVIRAVTIGVITLISAGILIVIGLVTGLVSAIIGAVQGVVAGFKIFLSGFDGIMLGFTRIVDGVLNVIDGFLNANSKNLITGIGQILSGAFRIIDGFLQGIVGIVSIFVLAVVGFFYGLVKGIYDFFYWLYVRLVGQSIVPDLVNEITKWFEKLIVNIPNALKEMGDKGLEKLGNFIEDFKTDVDDFVTEVKDSFYNAGKAFIQRLIDGIAEMLADLTGVVNSVGDLLDQVTGGGGQMGGSSGSTGGPPSSPGGTTGGGGNLPGSPVPSLVAPSVTMPTLSAPATSGRGATVNMNVNTNVDVAVLENVVRRVVRSEFSDR